MIINMQQGGVVPDSILDAQTITPNTENQVIQAGTYLRGDLTIAGDADLIPSKIPYDINLFGVQGNRKSGAGAYVWKKIEKILNWNTETTDFKLFYDYKKGSDYDSISLTYADEYKVNDDNTFTLLNPVTESNTMSSWKSVDLTNKYLVYDGNSMYKIGSMSSGTILYKIVSMENRTVYDGYYYIPTTAEISTIEVSTNDLYFVVDDDSLAYPDGDFHTDGYYYELLASISSANAMSLSDSAVDAVSSQIISEVGA